MAQITTSVVAITAAISAWTESSRILPRARRTPACTARCMASGTPSPKYTHLGQNKPAPATSQISVSAPATNSDTAACTANAAAASMRNAAGSGSAGASKGSVGISAACMAAVIRIIPHGRRDVSRRHRLRGAAGARG